MPYDTISVSTIFRDLFPVTQNKWRLLHYNNEFMVEYPDFSNFEPGKGYWFLTNNATNVNLGRGNAVKANENNPFTISLKPGWNMIGNPYLVTLDWKKVIAHNKTRGLITTELDNRNGALSVFENRAYSTTTSLSKYKGAFVNASSAVATLEIPISAIVNPVGRYTGGFFQNAFDGVPDIFDRKSNDWLFEIQIKNDVLKYNLAAVGMHRNATQSIDYLDWGNLPRLSVYLDIIFNEELSGSIVNISDTYQWHFTVNNNFDNKSVTITWDQDFFNHSAFGIILIDLINQRKIDMSATGFYDFIPVSSTHPFDLYYGKKTILDDFNLFLNLVGDAYPNPSDQTVNIPISLSGSSKVNIRMVDLIGRVVLKDVVQYSKGGYYEYTIDFDNFNNKMPEGIYIIRIGLDTASGIKIFNKKIMYKK